MVKNDGIIMLLDAVYHNGVLIGYISDEGIDWGGEDEKKVEVNASQRRDAPVKELTVRGATNELSFNMIELVPENLKAIIGGTIVGDRWNAPASTITAEGELKVLCGTGHTVLFANATMSGKIRGKIGGEQPLYVATKIKALTPRDGGHPYSIYPTPEELDTKTKALSFVKNGETKELDIVASGAFTVSQAPEGFTVDASRGRVRITASKNAGSSQRTGQLTFTLVSNPSKTLQVSLTQAG